MTAGLARATTRVGFITPSSNTVLEAVLPRMAGCTSPPVEQHFSRVKVTAIDLAPERLSQFDAQPMLEAARLLGDAAPDVISWAGTAGGWLGLDHDRAVAAAIEAETNIAATTTTLATVDLLRRSGVVRVGFATPYVPDVCAAIGRTFTRLGLVASVLGEGISDNAAFASVSRERIEKQVRALASDGCEAVCIFCTNVRFAEEADRLERELGVVILDSVSVTYWGALHRAGHPAKLAGYGQMFQ
jgi:maleate isomerase